MNLGWGGGFGLNLSYAISHVSYRFCGVFPPIWINSNCSYHDYHDYPNPQEHRFGGGRERLLPILPEGPSLFCKSGKVGDLPLVTPCSLEQGVRRPSSHRWGREGRVLPSGKNSSPAHKETPTYCSGRGRNQKATVGQRFSFSHILSIASVTLKTQLPEASSHRLHHSASATPHLPRDVAQPSTPPSVFPTQSRSLAHPGVSFLAPAD